MLTIKTTVENGTAIIYVMEDDRLINGLKRSFSTNEEAYAWLKARGVSFIYDFTNFVDYIATKGALGAKVLELLEKDFRFSLNGVLGGYENYSGKAYIRTLCQVLA